MNKIKNLQWWILAACATSLSMVFMDQTALPITLPAIQREFNASGTLLQWVVNSYLLILATFVIAGGKIADLYGHKRIFLIGQTIFVLSSISCALSPNMMWAIISRGVQGIGGALMIPATTAIIYNAFKPQERGRAMGVYIGISSVFLTLGPLLGGLLSQYLSWRWVFWVNFPIAILGVSIGLRVIPEDKQDLRWKKIDGLGFLLITLAIFTLVFALMEGTNLGWASAIIISCFVTTVVASYLFFVVERRHKNPLVDLAIFRDKTFAVGCSCLALVQAVAMCTIYWILYLQYVSGLAAGKAGVYLIMAQAPVTLMAPIAGRFVDRWGPRRVAQVATGVLILSYLWVAFAGAEEWLAGLLSGFVIFGATIPFMMNSIMSTALINISPQKRGVASGILNSSRQLGASIGLALLTSLMAILNYQGMSQLSLKQPQILPLLSHRSLEAFLSGGELTATVKNNLSASGFVDIFTLAKKMYAHNFSLMMIASLVLLFIIGFFVSQLPKLKIVNQQEKSHEANYSE
jgi:EmrB/QacA subfamily drug resistance transporter